MLELVNYTKYLIIFIYDPSINLKSGSLGLNRDSLITFIVNIPQFYMEKFSVH